MTERRAPPQKPVSINLVQQYPQHQQFIPQQHQQQQHHQQQQRQHQAQHQQYQPLYQQPQHPQQHPQSHPPKPLQSPQPQPPQPPSSLQRITAELHHIEHMNHELLSVAQKIRSLGIGQTTNIPAVDRLEIEMKQSLNQLIQHIMEFHIDIDGKLKNLGVFITTELANRNQISEGEVKSINEEKNDLKYEMLAEKISNLEVSLKQTQMNEKKLIQVIQNMMERYQINDQPTIIRDSPTLLNQFTGGRSARINTTTNSCANIATLNNAKTANNTKSVNKQERNKAVSPMPNANFNENKSKSIYQNLYTIEESVVSQGKTPASQQPNYFRLRQIQEQPEDQVYIKRLYSKYPTPNNPPMYPQSQDLKRSLRGQTEHGSQHPPQYVGPYNQQQPQSTSITMSSALNKQEKSTASQASIHQDDKQHRFNFMLGKLNM